MDSFKTALVVDDDAHNRKLLETLLQFEGLAVCSAESGTAALQMISAGELPEIILLDLMMPGMDGFEVVRRLKAMPAASGIPVIMVTALDDDASRARLAACGIRQVITKPIDRWELKACLAAATALGSMKP